MGAKQEVSIDLGPEYPPFVFEEWGGHTIHTSADFPAKTVKIEGIDRVGSERAERRCRPRRSL